MSAVKFVYVVCQESHSSGVVDWYHTSDGAWAEYHRARDAMEDGDYTTLFALEVPVSATSDEITELADEAMWECEGGYETPIAKDDRRSKPYTYGPGAEVQS